jgi:hypothetical protein
VASVSIFCEGTRLGKLKNGDSFTVDLTPGKHSCYGQDSRYGLSTLDVDSTGLVFDVTITGGGFAMPGISIIREATGDKMADANAPAAPPIRVFLGAQSVGARQVGTLRDQSIEMASDFAMDCPSVQITINESAADFTVQLNHIEAGVLVRDNQIVVYDKTGDLVGQREGSSIRKVVDAVCGMVTQSAPAVAAPAVK